MCGLGHACPGVGGQACPGGVHAEGCAWPGDMHAWETCMARGGGVCMARGDHACPPSLILRDTGGQ